MSDKIRRRQCAALAGHTGDEQTARSLLTDPDPSVRATALAALGRAGSLQEGDVRSGLEDPNATVRRRSCGLAIPYTDIDLVSYLVDEDNTVVEQAAWALGERGSAPGHAAVDALSSIVTTHDDALCRESAVAALGAIGDPAGLPAILQATSDKPPIRRRAVLALAPFEGPEVEEALTRAKDDRDWQVRQAAEDLSSENLVEEGSHGELRVVPVISVPVGSIPPWTTKQEFKEAMDQSNEQIRNGQTVNLGDFTQYTNEDD